MSNEKFTKGEWAINNKTGTDSIINISVGDFEIEHGCSSITLYNQDSDANAQLVKAAPEMYRLLEDMSKLMVLLDPQTHPQIELDAVKYDIDALLSKARGDNEEQ